MPSPLHPFQVPPPQPPCVSLGYFRVSSGEGDCPPRANPPLGPGKRPPGFSRSLFLLSSFLRGGTVSELESRRCVFEGFRAYLETSVLALGAIDERSGNGRNCSAGCCFLLLPLTYLSDSEVSLLLPLCRPLLVVQKEKERSAGRGKTECLLRKVL